MMIRSALAVLAVSFGATIAVGVVVTGQGQARWTGVLDEHPSIQYASRPTTDRVAKLGQAMAAGQRLLVRDARYGYLLSALDALGVPVESQLLVFSKSGVQREYTSPRNPRALYFNRSVVVGYVPGAPAIEIAAHDPQQGVVFYVLPQSGPAPVFMRQTFCVSCHVSASTLDVPGLIVRSNAVDEAGNLLPQLGSTDVDHRTPHADRWGGWFVTSEGVAAPYSQRAHEGNITFSLQGHTSSQVFIDWINSAPETHGYPSASSDVVSLLAFDHQARATNLLTRLNWEARVAAAGDPVAAESMRRLVDELADYFLFVGEAPLPIALTPRSGFAEHLASGIPKDARGRSVAQLDLVSRLLRYPCSYMIYSDAFDGLPQPVKTSVYRRIRELLSGDDVRLARLNAETRRAIVEILAATKADF